MKHNKRAFTIVELVIVIAILAILAAVLIPTFVNLVNKANISADIQAVRQMNTALATHDQTDKPENINAAIRALAKDGFDLNNYKPLGKDMQFYWVKDLNRVVYANSSFEVTYPDEHKGLEKISGNWFCLNGEIKLEDYKIEDNAVAVSNAGQLASLINDFNNGVSEAKAVTEITLTEDIDLAGSAYKFIGNDAKGITSGNVVINGNGHTISGFRDDKNTFFGSGEFANKGYGYGLFTQIGKDATVTLKNVTLSGLCVQDSKNDETGTMGMIAGYVYGKLVMENVTITDSSVTGYQKIGAVAGRVLSGGELTMTNVTLKNVSVSGGVEVAKLVGRVDSGAAVTVQNVTATENVTVSLGAVYSDYSGWAKDIATDKLSEAIGETLTGKKYVLWDKDVYVLVTEDYYWYNTGAHEFTMDGETYTWYWKSTSDNITK